MNRETETPSIGENGVSSPSNSSEGRSSAQEKHDEIIRLTGELQRELQAKTLDVEEQTSEIKLLQEWKRKHTKTEKRLERKLEKAIADSGKLQSTIDLLENSISEKDNELALFKARYFRDEAGNSELHLAAMKGDEQAIKELIRSGADVNARNNNCATPIILAGSGEGDGNATLKIVKFLIEQKANALAKDVKGATFLNKIASRKISLTAPQFHDISNYLVSRKLTSLFNIGDMESGTTPFMLAAKNVKMDMAIVSLLQTNGVALNQLDNKGESFLSYAMEGDRNINLPSQLIVNGSTKQKTLVQAIVANDEELVKVLVRLGADKNQTNDDGETPLHLAAKSSPLRFALNTIVLLIRSGANVDAKDKANQTFLHRLCGRRFMFHSSLFHDFVCFLLCRDLCGLFNSPDRELNTPFQFAVRGVKIQIATLSLLQDNGVEFNAVDRSGWSVLHWATWGNQPLELISDLVDFGAKPELLDTLGQSLLHFAAENCRVELLSFLLDKGLDINARDWLGRTPLHSVILQGGTDVFETVQFLLRNGADPSIVDKMGKSPYDLFIEKRERYPDAEKIFTCFSLRASC